MEPVEKKEIRPIEEQLVMMSNNLEQLEGAINSLEMRLMPVLRNMKVQKGASDGDSVEVEKVASIVLDDLINKNHQINKLFFRIAELNTRLDV